MAAYQAQVTVPSNGTQVAILTQEPVNASQLNLRNTGGVTVLLGPQALLSPPLSFTGTPSGSGGTFAAGNYYWQVTATNVFGETTPSLEFTAALSLNGSCALQWAQVIGATGYKVYRSTTSGGEHTTPALVATIGSGATVTYSDTGTAVSSGATPSTNLAAIPVVFPILANEYLGLAVAPDDILVAQVQTPGTAGQITLLAMG